MNIQRGLALVVSNDKYQFCNQLPSCKKDGYDMKESLRVLGFDIFAAHDFTRAHLFELIDRFIIAADSYSTVLLYYSGHGVQIDGENYIVPIDCKPTPNKSILINTGLVPIKIIADYMNAHPQRSNIIILDACRTSPSFTKDILSGGLAEIKSGRGTFISFATAPNTVAIGSPSPDENSIFTACLLQHIDKPNIKIEELFKQVRSDVIIRSGGTQNPWESTSLTDDFFFNIMSEDQINENIYKAIRDNSSAVNLIYLSDYYQKPISEIYRIYYRQKSEKPGGIHFSDKAEFEAYILHQILELGFEFKHYRWMYNNKAVVMGEFYHRPSQIALEPLGKGIDVTINLCEPQINETGCAISGITNLPFNTKLMINLQNTKLRYFAQCKAQIQQDGSFCSDCFTYNKGAFPNGEYKVIISMPVANVQTKDVQSIIGERGCNLMGTYVSSSIINGKTVEFQQIITIKN
ncbi:caspase family protein [Anaerolentibacter hominis]|uniref:caspase family protein n=1 Tax=Anaerolentibacter hominis TaxID=3079009 RepID=UPI0031B853F6